MARAVLTMVVIGAGWQTRIGEVLEDHVASVDPARGRSSAVAEARSGYRGGTDAAAGPKRNPKAKS